ncbi:MAG: hypothetical protein QOF30_966 [Acidimicrobiaceae bacterium]|nr:hypothetical protein [Acidimicrobiaceae bacterium]
MAAEGELRDRHVAKVLEHMRLENEHDFPKCIDVFGRARYEIVATGEIHDGVSGVASFLQQNRTAFPDFRFEPTLVTPGDDAVLVEGSFTGTHEGNWRGLPATGRSVDFRMAVIFQFDGEDLVGERIYFDLSTPLRQLGVARDPLTLGGQLTTALNHPVTIARALYRAARRGLKGRTARER